jgi:putative ABC transport system substrate-binding protein
MPVIGFLSAASPGLYAHLLRAFRQGLSETGFVEGRNVTIEFRWAEGQTDRIPAFAADLVRHQVAVMAVGGVPAAQAAKSATPTIPIVFSISANPVEIGLVASLNRPGGNVTGHTSMNVELGPKRLEMLREMVPNATIMAALVNPASAANAEAQSKNLQEAARLLGLQLHILHVSTEHDFDDAFESLVRLKAGALVVGTDTLFIARREQLIALTHRHAVPTIFPFPEFVAAGGLMAYSASVTETYRQVGNYTGRILKGDKPADLPVQQATRIELIINIKTAKALGLTIPLPLIGRTDEWIE